MVFKTIPKVHESRLAGTSSHLIGEGTDAAHVFLKVEAFKSVAELSIISDLDVVVTKREPLAEYINRFHRAPHRDAKVLPPSTVVVILRKLSQILFNKTPQVISESDWSRYHHEQGRMPVSYSWAFIRPTIELAERYEAVMQRPASSQSLLSDQDLLAEVISPSFTLSDHAFIAFTSWWVHYDMCQRQTQEVMEGHNPPSQPRRP